MGIEVSMGINPIKPMKLLIIPAVGPKRRNEAIQVNEIGSKKAIPGGMRGIKGAKNARTIESPPNILPPAIFIIKLVRVLRKVSISLSSKFSIFDFCDVI
jgi:hypothetical protein